MKKLIILSIISLSIFSCKKEKTNDPVINTVYSNTIIPCPEYIVKASQDTLNVEYRVKTKVSSYQATYNKFAGFNLDGSAIMLSITQEMNGNDTIKFKSIASEFGLKYHYQIFTLAKVSDSLEVSLYINNIIKGKRPNYGSVFNFAFTDY